MVTRYDATIGPFYRHVEEHRFRLRRVGNARRLINDLARLCRSKPRLFHGRTRLTLRADEVQRLGLRGVGLVLQSADRFSIWYRTAYPKSARSELQRLINRLRPPKLGLRCPLRRRKRITYFERYACIPQSDAKVLLRTLPSSEEPPDSHLLRPGLKVLYARCLPLPLARKRALTMALVFYRPERSRTPDYLKLEIKGPMGRKRPLSAAIRNRAAAYLSYLLTRSYITPGEKPSVWVGTSIPPRRHVLGPTQKKLLALLAAAPEKYLSLATIHSHLPGVDRRNLVASLQLAATTGLVSLVLWRRHIRGVRLIDFDAIAPKDCFRRCSDAYLQTRA